MSNLPTKEVEADDYKGITKYKLFCSLDTRTLSQVRVRDVH